MTQENYKLRRYLTHQYKEIQEHKYFLSQKKNKDVGQDYATEDFIFTKYKGQTNAERFAEHYKEHYDVINYHCDSVCGKGVCNGMQDGMKSLDDVIAGCHKSNQEIHKELAD